MKLACSLEEKLWPQHRHHINITLSAKVCLAKAMVFPVVMYGCESWTIKKAEHQRIEAFKLWCWRRLLRVPWTASRSNQYILKEISPEYSLEGLMLKLKLQYFGHLVWRTDSLEETLVLGKIEGRRRRGWQRMRWLDGITDLMDMSLSKLRELVIGQGGLACCSPWGAELDTTERLNWTELKFLSNVNTFMCFLLLRKILWFPMGFQASWQTSMSYLGPRRTPWHPSAHRLKAAVWWRASLTLYRMFLLL